jgi:hypothetical protein
MAKQLFWIVGMLRSIPYYGKFGKSNKTIVDERFGPVGRPTTARTAIANAFRKWLLSLIDMTAFVNRCSESCSREIRFGVLSYNLHIDRSWGP